MTVASAKERAMIQIGFIDRWLLYKVRDRVADMNSGGKMVRAIVLYSVTSQSKRSMVKEQKCVYLDLNLLLISSLCSRIGSVIMMAVDLVKFCHFLVLIIPL